MFCLQLHEYSYLFHCPGSSFCPEMASKALVTLTLWVGHVLFSMMHCNANGCARNHVRCAAIKQSMKILGTGKGTSYICK